MRHPTYAQLQLSSTDLTQLKAALSTVGQKAMTNLSLAAAAPEIAFHRGVAAWSAAEVDRLESVKGGKVKFSEEQLKRAIGCLQTSRQAVF